MTCLPCLFIGLLGVRFLGCLTTTVSVIRFWLVEGCEIFDASRTVSLIAANLGSKDFQSEVQCCGREKFEVAGRSGALLGSGTGAHERHGWSMEVPDTLVLWPESRSQKIPREAHNQEVIAGSNDLAQWPRQEKKTWREEW